MAENIGLDRDSGGTGGDRRDRGLHQPVEACVRGRDSAALPPAKTIRMLMPELEVLALDQGPGMANPEPVPARRLQHRRLSGPGAGRHRAALHRRRTSIRMPAAAPRFWRDGPPPVARRRPRQRHGAANGGGQRPQARPGGLRRLVGSRASRKRAAWSWWRTAWATARKPRRRRWKRSACCTLNPDFQPGRAARARSPGAAQHARRGRQRGAHRPGKGTVTFAGVGNVSAQIYSAAQAGPSIWSRSTAPPAPGAANSRIQLSLAATTACW